MTKTKKSTDPLELVCQQILNASRPEDVFGDLKGTTLIKEYRDWAKRCHPDQAPARLQRLASDAFARLTTWRDFAAADIQLGLYAVTDKLRRIEIKTKDRTYNIQSLFRTSAIYQEYWAKATNEPKPVLVKILRVPTNADLARAEENILRASAAAVCLRRLLLMQHAPTLLECFEVKQGARTHLAHALKIDPKPSITLERVMALQREQPGDWLSLADAAWMFNRLLSALQIAQLQGYVHAGAVPSNFLIVPETHNGVLLEWSQAVKIGEKARCGAMRDRPFYPPELMAGEPLTSATDVYMAAKTMQQLLGGDPATHVLPPHLPGRVVGLLKSCWMHQSRRPQNVEEVFNEFGELLRKVFGPPKFRPFVMPKLAVEEP